MPKQTRPGTSAPGQVTRGERSSSEQVAGSAWLVFGWMVPGEARVVPRAELDEAKAWLAG